MKMSTRAFVKPSSLLTILAVLAGASWAVAQNTVEPPPNAPAAVQWNVAEGKLSLQYHGAAMLEATIGAEGDDVQRIVTEHPDWFVKKADDNPFRQERRGR